MKRKSLRKHLPFLLAALLTGTMTWYHHIYVNWERNERLFPVAVALSVLVFLALAISVIWPGEAKPLTKCLQIFGWSAAFVGVQQGLAYLIHNVADWEDVLTMRTVLPLLAVIVILLLIKPFRALEHKKKITACIAAFLLILASASAMLWIESPPRPSGQLLDMSKFELTWSDEFDGDTLNMEKWGQNFYKEAEKIRGDEDKHSDSYFSREMADVRDGKLYIRTAWVEEGIGGSPAGWYSLWIDTRNTFSQTFGYFEMRCKLPKGQGQNAAFWMHTVSWGDSPDDFHTGVEIDIFEYPNYQNTWPRRDSVGSAVHNWSGGHVALGVAHNYVRKPHDTFHTYGVEWNENEYIFYIDGVETGRTSFGGVCRNNLYLLISNAAAYGDWSGDIRKNKPGVITDWVVDYVRAYQYKELL